MFGCRTQGRGSLNIAKIIEKNDEKTPAISTIY